MSLTRSYYELVIIRLLIELRCAAACTVAVGLGGWLARSIRPSGLGWARPHVRSNEFPIGSIVSHPHATDRNAGRRQSDREPSSRQARDHATALLALPAPRGSVCFPSSSSTATTASLPVPDPSTTRRPTSLASEAPSRDRPGPVEITCVREFGREHSSRSESEGRPAGRGRFLSAGYTVRSG